MYTKKDTGGFGFGFNNEKYITILDDKAGETSTDQKLQMFGVDSATMTTTTDSFIPYNNTFNGIIGFLPSDTSNSQYSFLDNLVSNNVIKAKTVSFLIDTNYILKGSV